jgi:polyhydroxyalkanoate synthase
MFNLLQPSQLIWSNVVTNYLMGQKPPAFDMLYWNSDSTSLPRDAHVWYLRNTYVENNLKEPGKVEFNGRPIDLRKIEGDIYSVGTRKDHIAPWKSGWAICRLTNGNIRYALAGGGHIAGVVSPPDKARGYWVSDGCRPIRDRRRVARERRRARRHLVGGLDGMARAALRRADRSAPGG